MKAPRSCPNSSLSMIVSGSAPQSTGTNGPPRRGLAAWSARATSSLPVPLSPWISTLLSLWRRLSTLRWSARIAARAPDQLGARRRARAALARARGCGAPGGAARSPPHGGAHAVHVVEGLREVVEGAARACSRPRSRCSRGPSSRSPRPRAARASGGRAARDRSRFRGSRSSSTTSSVGSASASARRVEALGEAHVVALRPQDARERAQEQRLVVHEQRRRRAALSGRTSAGVAQPPARTLMAIAIGRARTGALSAADVDRRASPTLRSGTPSAARRSAVAQARTSSWSTTRSCTGARSSASSHAWAIGSATARDASEAMSLRRARAASTSCSATCACPASAGSSWCARSTRSQPDLPCIVITGYGSAEASVEALRAGAFWYLEKPFEPGAPRRGAPARRRRRSSTAGSRPRTALLQRQLRTRYRFENIDRHERARCAACSTWSRRSRTPTARC